MTETAATAVLTFSCLWLALGALNSLLYPAIRKPLLNIHPQQRAGLLLAIILAPLAIATLLTALLYWPPLALIDSHCHGNACEQHSPQSALALLPGLLLTLLLSGRLAGIYWRQIKPAQQLQKKLARFAIDRGAYLEVHSDRPAAFTLGWRAPKVFLSSALLQHLDDDALQCILQHENSHRRRRDNLRLLLIGLACAPLPGPLMQALTRDHSLACEQSCDLAAASNSSKEQVAATLLQVSRLQTCSPRTACAFADSHTQQRVMALLATTPCKLPALALLPCLLAIGALCLWLINPLHVLLEHLL